MRQAYHSGKALSRYFFYLKLGHYELDYQALIGAFAQAKGLSSELVRSKPTHPFCKYWDKTSGFMRLLVIRR
jgi:hypothetical protein